MDAAQALTGIVATATRAPSMHNTQPWLFRVIPAAAEDLRGAVIEVRSDPRRRLPVADPTGWAVRVACGAALLGVRLAVTATGHTPQVSVLPDPVDAELIGRVRIGEPRPATPQERELYTAIGHRRSNRSPFHDVPAAPGSGTRLQQAARAEGAWLDVLDDPRDRAAVAGVVWRAQDQLAADPAYAAELASWVRAGADGVPERAAGPAPARHDLLALRDFGSRPRAPGRDFEPNPLVCVLGTDTDRASDQVRAGMALYRVLLAATAAGLAASILSQPIELPQLRHELRTALRRTGGWPQMVLRVGYGTLPPASPRRPVADVLDIAPVPAG
jgi:nitroreductase